MVADVDLEVAALSVHHGEVVHQDGRGESEGGPVVRAGDPAVRRHSGAVTRAMKYFILLNYFCD